MSYHTFALLCTRQALFVQGSAVTGACLNITVYPGNSTAITCVAPGLPTGAYNVTLVSNVLGSPWQAALLPKESSMQHKGYVYPVSLLNVKVVVSCH